MIHMEAYKQTMELIPLSMLELSGNGYSNPRITIRQEDIQALKDNIASVGLQSALLAWDPSSDGQGSLIVIDGQRRLLALRELVDEGELDPGTELYVWVLQGSLPEVRTLALSTNLQREELSVAESSKAVYELYQDLKRQVDVAAALSMSQAWVSQMTSLWGGLCDAARQAFIENLIPHKAAREMSRILKEDGSPDEDLQHKYMLSLLGDDVAPEELVPERTRIREKKTRTKSEFKDLEITVLDALENAKSGTVPEGEADDLRDYLTWLSALRRVCLWYRTEKSLEELISGRDFSDAEAGSEGDDTTEESQSGGRGARVTRPRT